MQAHFSKHILFANALAVHATNAATSDRDSVWTTWMGGGGRKSTPAP